MSALEQRMALLLEWERGWQRGERSKACCPVAALQNGSGFDVRVLYVSSYGTWNVGRGGRAVLLTEQDVGRREQIFSWTTPRALIIATRSR